MFLVKLTAVRLSEIQTSYFLALRRPVTSLPACLTSNCAPVHPSCGLSPLLSTPIQLFAHKTPMQSLTTLSNRGMLSYLQVSGHLFSWHRSRLQLPPQSAPPRHLPRAWPSQSRRHPTGRLSCFCRRIRDLELEWDRSEWTWDGRVQ